MNEDRDFEAMGEDMEKRAMRLEAEADARKEAAMFDYENDRPAFKECIQKAKGFLGAGMPRKADAWAQEAVLRSKGPGQFRVATALLEATGRAVDNEDWEIQKAQEASNLAADPRI